MGFSPKKKSDYDGNFMDDLSPLSSPSIREVLAILDQNNNGLNPISETFPQIILSTNLQSEHRSGGLHDRLAARLGFDIPPLEIESISSFDNSFKNPTLVPSPILVISPGFSSLSPFLQSPNMFSNSSSQNIHPYPIPNGMPPETVGSSGTADATIIISNNNLPHHPQGGSEDIPVEKSFYIASHESNAGPIGAPLVPSCDSEVVAETDGMNLISLENGSEEDDKDREYNQEENNVINHNVVVEPPSPKKRKMVVSNMMGVTRKNRIQMVITHVESEEDHPDDGFRWRKYGQKVVTGNANPRSYYRCTYTGCKVRKHVERSADNVKFVVAAYDGIHEHAPPYDGIPVEKSSYITSHESNAGPIGAPLVPSCDSEVVAETDVMNLISLENGSENDDKYREYNQEENNVINHNAVVEPPSSKKRKMVVSNMMGVTRKNRIQMVITHVESEEDHPDDGFRWRKYGQKVVTGNANPRSYYKCTYTGCKVRKHVERSADNVKFVVAAYDGIHEHVPPPERLRKSGTKNQSESSMSQDPINQTLGLGRPTYSSSASQLFPSALDPQLDMNRNDELKIDRVIPDGTEVFKGICERLSLNFGINFLP